MENVIKGVVAAVSAFVSAKLGVLAPWMGAILLAMVIDYVTGMASAWATKTLSSRIGIIGILKKVGYVAVIVVGMMLDWMIKQAGSALGVQIPEAGFLALLVIVWLFINEAVSILENIGELGVNYPTWLKGLLLRLKSTVDEQAEKFTEGDKKDD